MAAHANCDLRPQGNITGLTGLMDFKDNGSNAHVQFEILGSSFSETFGKDVKRVSSRRFTLAALRRERVEGRPMCSPAAHSKPLQEESLEKVCCVSVSYEQDYHRDADGAASLAQHSHEILTAAALFLPQTVNSPASRGRWSPKALFPSASLTNYTFSSLSLPFFISYAHTHTRSSKHCALDRFLYTVQINNAKQTRTMD